MVSSRRPLPAEWHNQKLVFPSNYTYRPGAPDRTLMMSALQTRNWADATLKLIGRKHRLYSTRIPLVNGGRSQGERGSVTCPRDAPPAPCRCAGHPPPRSVRGIERTKLFRADADRADCIVRLADLADQGALTGYAWVLLPNHTYLLIPTAQRSTPSWSGAFTYCQSGESS
jgi:hypothetical protein